MVHHMVPIPTGKYAYKYFNDRLLNDPINHAVRVSEDLNWEVKVELVYLYWIVNVYHL